MQCYKKILELEPENVQGLHNLCVVYVERGNLLEAENCLQHVHTLAPNEDYISRHLQIVQTRISKLKLQENSSQVNKWKIFKQVNYSRMRYIQSLLLIFQDNSTLQSEESIESNNTTLRKRIRNNTEGMTEKDVVVPKNIDKRVNPSSLS